ncbi:DNA polymerase epsilon subunit 4 isoform X2 [Drosophila gunungcola]|uniref:DNA polymerase epsilon subunit 4 isoform X2 n=1 Tax=Drosophila gunungcola TaxID=103775 RepID=UPI0022E695B3|nr:DNA polymerase epsilon subunit 4 isoform X2 [Drosophila gunungcola]
MASENLFAHEFSEEHDLELEQAMETEADEPGETEEPPEVVDETPDSPPEESTTEPLADKPVTNGHKPSADHEAKMTQLPLARIRNIMKLDPDMQVATNEAVFTVAKAVELFIASLSRESYTYTAQSKKKTIQKRDVEMAISAVDSLMFLDGAMNF